MSKKHLGGDFDEFLRDEGILEDAEAVAAKRVIAYQIAQEMELANISQAELARRMKTSRSAVERLLDPAQPLGHPVDLGTGGECRRQASEGAADHIVGVRSNKRIEPTVQGRLVKRTRGLRLMRNHVRTIAVDAVEGGG